MKIYWYCTGGDYNESGSEWIDSPSRGEAILNRVLRGEMPAPHGDCGNEYAMVIDLDS